MKYRGRILGQAARLPTSRTTSKAEESPVRRSIPIVSLIAAVFAPSMAAAQDYPSRPVKTLTTTSAGGISDIFMRALGDELHKRWGQPIVVENRPGGMQNLGARACTEAAPDGYTICILNAEPVAYN
jgi:tripartite-type tricarboxylate transporter receptor subunit TctC